MQNSDDGNLEQNFLSLKINAENSSGANQIGSDGVNVSNECSDSKKRGVCQFYSKQGYCKYANNCRYIHVRRNNIKTSCYRQRVTASANHNYDRASSSSIHSESNSSSKQTGVRTCRYFMMGQCEKGSFCHYDHSSELGSYQSKFKLNTGSEKFCRKQNSTIIYNNLKKTSTPICYYYKKGFCRNGSNCKFYHQEKRTSERNLSVCSTEKENTEKSVDSSNHNIDLKNSVNVNKESIISLNTRNVYEIKFLSDDDNLNIRNIEIKQLKRRFPAHKILEDDKIFVVCFQPSDPDWPFDVKSLELEVDFPRNYPKEVCTVTVLQSNENIPLLLVKHMNSSISDWLHEKYQSAMASEKVELVFRPFLKWFDRSLEELFICGLRQVKQDLMAKEAGIEFVPPEKLFPSCEKSNVFDLLDTCENSSVILDSKDDVIPQSQIELETQPSDNQLSKTNNNSSNQGLKIILSSLELTEGAAALTCTRISITFQCSRCKTPFNMKSVPKQCISHKCLKCAKDLGFTFEASTIHQFSNVLGNLHLMDCQAVDLNMVECHFLVDCLNCSKQVAVDGIHYGQHHKMWCIFCNQKLIISVGSVKFQASKLLPSANVKYSPAKKLQKKTINPVVNEGQPLPQFGACKHYKKSFRWLRFPCCGRIYPCDECHNEKENDHEMKFANRMICGYCAKEQPYSREKPCFECSQNLTKKSGSHWEGGKGCRNKIVMGREDKQKYSGISKTVSKKSQNSGIKKRK